MMKLCGFPISNYYNKVHIAMLEKGLPFELDAECKPSQKDDFLARTPMGKIPFLELDGGAQLSESQVICEYLEDAYPQKPLYPRDPLERARVRELISFMELHMELQARRRRARGTESCPSAYAPGNRPSATACTPSRARRARPFPAWRCAPC